ncbi:MAG TPA: cysteine rich repeat-containing protein [Rhodopila sp.]|uniref:cysteine rich repeat-containing protein n=1 Tax=Rhodopila sp. TaxID=2480087 RepID=UPI002BA8E39B|nr:cysteine rich repeat-containing protein [Rhodopila sp.]HVY16248.1 cysteine rich repeat-containing protein [Rhodopila sp.]
MAIPVANARTLVAALLLCASAVTAAAQQPTQAQASAVKQYCRSDYQAYCASVPPGGAASLQCLQQNVASLSPTCGNAVRAATGGGAANTTAQASAAPVAMPPSGMPPSGMSPRQEAGLMRRACAGDYRAYCSGVPLGGGRAIGCLSANEKRLSPSCRGAMAGMRGGR